MRRFILSICILVSSVLFAAAAPDHDYVVKFEQIPAVSQTFVTTHFAKVQVSYCMRDSHSFEVRLTDASEIEFNLDGTWKEVDCKYKEIPASVSALFPSAISTYVKDNFPTAAITKVSAKMWGFEIELNNGLEIEFNTEGQFLKIDD